MSDSTVTPILGFDCSGGACSAAIAVDGTVRAFRFAVMDRGQADALLPQVRDVLGTAGLKMADIAALATTVGPGSFTGLRIGLAAAKGLALAVSKPIIAFSSFEAYVAGVASTQEAEQIVVAIDSKRGPAFVQLFDRNREPILPAVTLEAGQLDAWLPLRPTLVIGDAADLFQSLDRADLRIDRDKIRIDASAITLAAAKLGRSGIGRLPCTPLYLRAPDVTMPKSPPP